MSTSTVTPTAIDAFVHIESVRVVDRHRWDLGDLQPLADSIADLGLLNPITLTRDARLIAGQRRLEACRLLGWAEVPVRFADSLDDAVKLLHAERDENVCRKEMLPSELAALGDALYAIEAERAKERQRNGQERGRATRHGLDYSGQGGNQCGLETAAVVGGALGMSRSTYADLRSAYNVANDPDRPDEERALARTALAEMDGGRGIQPSVNEMRRKLRAKRDAAEAMSAALAPEPETVQDDESSDGEPLDWVPEPNDKTRAGVARRRQLIAEMAASGHTSTQIGDRLGIIPPTIRRIAREEGITIPADQVIARTRHRIDSNRIIRETIQELENLDVSLKLVHFDELDTSQISDWTASLSNSIRVLNRLNKQLKEMVQ